MITLTERQIDEACQNRNEKMLEKETLFILNNMALELSTVYREHIDYVKPIKVKMKTDKNYWFQEKTVTGLKKILSLSSQIQEEPIEFSKVKIDFDVWFYDTTSEGILHYDYQEDALLSITEASKELGVSRTTLYQYIERGLETVGEKGKQKIPRIILDAWKDPAYAFQMQWIHQIKKMRTQTKEEQLECITRQIAEFEKEYHGTYDSLFGNLSENEIDAMSESVDIYDWRELEHEKLRLLQSLGE